MANGMGGRGAAAAAMALAAGLAAALAVASADARAQGTVPHAVLRSGTLVFAARATVGDFEGRTTTVTGEVPGGTSLADARGWVEAPVATLRTGNSRRDRDMLASLEADRHPTIRLDVHGVRAPAATLADSMTVTLRGALTIHGVTRDVEMPATLVRRADTVHVTSAFPLQLHDYRIGGLSKLLGALRVRDDVQVRAELRFVVATRE